MHITRRVCAESKTKWIPQGTKLSVMLACLEVKHSFYILV